MRPLSIFVAVACGAVFAQALADDGGAHTRYRVTVLSGTSARGYSIDDLGIVAGSYKINGATHATLWAFGTQVDLGTLGTGPLLNSRVQWPVKDNLGLISGISLTDELDPNKEGWSCSDFIANPNFNVCRGFIWDPLTKKMHALRTLGGTNSFATGTNNLGETAGWAENKVKDPTCVAPQVEQFRPVVWGPGREEIRELPPLEGDHNGAATALNDRGQVVGISGDCGVAAGSVSAKHAVLWDNGVPIELKNPNHAPYWNTPMMINQRGDVVGFAGFPNDPDGNLTPPFIWTRKSGWKFIPMLQGEIGGVASSINDRRQVVGYSYDVNSVFHPWIWREGGRPTNLNDLIEPNADMVGPITSVSDINERGVITGKTATQAVTLTPIHEEE